MHRQYGPIVRISPHELHVSDPSFFEKLYNRDGVWNKYDWAYDAHNLQLSTLAAIDHHIHKQRRSPINPFFSKASVARSQNLVRDSVSLLCQRLEQISKSNSPDIKLSTALGALARDVATSFLLGKSFGNLDAEDFHAGVGDTLQASGGIWRITKHIRWYGPMMQSIPTALIKKIGDQGIIQCLGFVEDMTKTCAEIRSAFTSNKNGHNNQRTVVDAIMSSDLPPPEKSPERLRDEVITIAGAAFETTAYSLSLTIYHIYQNSAILNRLRAELASLNPDGYGGVDLTQLEQLPYLTAVLTEGLRLSPAIATRMARVAPDRDIMYGEWRIPAGTPVGMTLLSMHTDPQLYHNPEQFDPDRWMDHDRRKRVDGSYAPFGRGTRICVGMHLAWAELYLVVSALVQRFDFKFDAHAGKDVTWASDQFTIGTVTRNGLKATVTVREA
ncbi:cytochrome P450 [Xylariomycetidae sp. FL2044]|nr:cytochrome P450 [Xylariomycetidae sp. FL2044]